MNEDPSNKRDPELDALANFALHLPEVNADVHARAIAKRDAKLLPLLYVLARESVAQQAHVKPKKTISGPPIESTDNGSQYDFS